MNKYIVEALEDTPVILCKYATCTLKYGKNLSKEEFDEYKNFLKEYIDNPQQLDELDRYYNEKIQSQEKNNRYIPIEERISKSISDIEILLDNRDYDLISALYANLQISPDEAFKQKDLFERIKLCRILHNLVKKTK